MSTCRLQPIALLIFVLFLAAGCQPPVGDNGEGLNSPRQGAAETAAPAAADEAEKEVDEKQIVITAVGDLLMHMPLVQAAQRDEGYDFAPLFAPVADELHRGDLTIANLETTLAGPQRGFSGYPLFNTPDELLDGLEESGVDMLITANNHSMDRGADGLLRTLQVVREAGFAAVGTRLTPEEPPYTLVEVNGLRVAVVAYTYGTNGIPVPEPHLINLIDRDEMAAHIDEARRHNPHLLLAAMHWGLEYHRQPSEEQKELALFLHQQGVDAVIGTHPHVVQPIELIWPQRVDEGTTASPTPIIYSTGNFVSNQPFPYTDTGLIVHLTFTITTTSAGQSFATLDQLEYVPVWMQRHREGGRLYYQAVPTTATPAAGEALTGYPLQPAHWQRLREAHGEVEDLVGPSPVFQRHELKEIAFCALGAAVQTDCPG